MSLPRAFDRSLLVQYVEWFSRVARGDLGISRLEGQLPVGQILWSKTLHTLELVIVGVALALAIAVPMGVGAATAGGWPDQIIRVVAMLGFSTPSYWLAILLMLLFAAKLGWLPAGGFVPFADNPLLHLQYLLLPVLTVAFIEAAEPGQTDRFLALTATAERKLQKEGLRLTFEPPPRR